MVRVQFFKITLPLFLIVEICVLFPHDLKQAALHGDKQLVIVTLVGLPATAKIHIGQLHIAAILFDIYFSWRILHRKYFPSELSRLLPALLLD